MVSSSLNKRTRISLLLSLMVHVTLLLVLGFTLIDQHEETASGFVSVHIVEAAEHTTPPRRMETRETIRNLSKPIMQRAKIRSEPRRLNQADIDTDFSTQIDSPDDRAAALPEIVTYASHLKSRFEMTIPKPTGAAIKKPGTGDRKSAGDRGFGAGSIGLSDGAGIFESALYSIARDVVGKNRTGREDIVFIVDASGSMEENIAAVARYLSRMLDVFKESHLDYTIGVISFNRVLKNNNIKVYEQTADVSQIRAILRSIECDGDERTLDAIETGLTQIEFRDTVDKTFVLVTDEPFTPRTLTRRVRKELSLRDMLQEDFQEIVKMCRDDGVKVSVLGIEDEMHKSLAEGTRGLWFRIPQPESLM